MRYFPNLHMYVVDIFWITSFDFFERKLAEMPGKQQSAFFEGFQATQIHVVLEEAISPLFIAVYELGPTPHPSPSYQGTLLTALLVFLLSV